MGHDPRQTRAGEESRLLCRLLRDGKPEDPLAGWVEDLDELRGEECVGSNWPAPGDMLLLLSFCLWSADADRPP